MTQTALPLEPVEPLPMREAFDRTGLRNKYTYEQALTKPALALTIRLYAEVIARERKECQQP